MIRQCPLCDEWTFVVTPMGALCTNCDYEQLPPGQVVEPIEE